MQDYNPEQETAQAQQQGSGRTQQKKSGGSLWWLWLIIILLVIGGGVAYAVTQPGTLGGLLQGQGTQQNGDKEGAVATVNGNEITRSQFEARLTQNKQTLGSQQELSGQQLKQLKQQTLETLINEELVLQEAEASNLSVTDKEVQNAYTEVKNRFDSDQKFQQELQKNGLTEEDLQKNIRRQLLVQKYINENTNTQNIQVSDEEAQQAYDQAAQQAGEDQQIPPFEQVKSQIKSRIKQQKQGQEVNTMIQDLRENADIQKMLDLSAAPTGTTTPQQ